jgi:hypothetical protein
MADDTTPFQPRPGWWVQAQDRDVSDLEGDERAEERDQAAAERDIAATRREKAAGEREQHAADLAVQAHERLDKHSQDDLAPLVHAEALRKDEGSLERIRELLQSQPELAAVFDRVQRHVDELYVALLFSGYQQDEARSNLRSLAQLLAAAAADRREAEHDRAHARTDRSDAKHDRDNARTGRQQSAIDRAPRSSDDDN